MVQEKQSNDSPSQEARDLCEKRRAFKKNILDLQFRNTRKWIAWWKKKWKKKKKKKLDEKINKLRDDFKKIDLHNLFRSVHELEGKLKKRLLVVKNQKKVESAKQNKFLKCGKNILNNISIQSFLIIKYLGIHS